MVMVLTYSIAKRQSFLVCKALLQQLEGGSFGGAGGRS